MEDSRDIMLPVYPVKYGCAVDLRSVLCIPRKVDSNPCWWWTPFHGKVDSIPREDGQMILTELTAYRSMATRDISI